MTHTEIEAAAPGDERRVLEALARCYDEGTKQFSWSALVGMRPSPVRRDCERN